jgi:hypothetical protein
MIDQQELNGIVERLRRVEELSPEESEAAKLAASGAGPVEIPAGLTGGDEDAEKVKATASEILHGVHEGACADVRQEVSKMTLPQKIKAALFGNAACRAILVRDTNRMVQQFVLKNPRLQSAEVEEFAKNPNISEQVLRAIGGNQSWTKLYSTKLNLVLNPKTPSDVALKWLRYLTESDIKRIARSKNLPQVVIVAAKKRLTDLTERNT